MATFAFKKEIKLDKGLGKVLGTATANSILSDNMKLDGDNVVMEYLTEFEGPDLAEVSKSMRQIPVDFSTAPEH